MSYPKIISGCDASHTFYISPQGKLYATGNNDFGQLGLGEFGLLNFRMRFEPVVIEREPGTLAGRVIAAAVGARHSLVLLANGDVYAAGDNRDGQLGLDGTDGRVRFTRVPLAQRAITIAAGQAYSLIILADGKVYATGSNLRGQLGLGDSGFGTHRPHFEQVTGLPDGQRAIAVAAGIEHSLVLLANGDVYAAGWNMFGQLGLGDSGFSADRTRFTRVTTLPDDQLAIGIYAGLAHSLILMANNQLCSAGANSDGQLGLNHKDDTIRFTPVASLPDGQRIIRVAAGCHHSLVLLSNGDIFVTGHNEYGQLGLGDFRPNNCKLYFERVTRLPDGQRIINIAAGASSSYILLTHGAYSTGLNHCGQLGLNNDSPMNPSMCFERVASLSDIPSSIPSRKELLQKLHRGDIKRLHQSSLLVPQCIVHGIVTPVGDDECPYCIFRNMGIKS